MTDRLGIKLVTGGTLVVLAEPPEAAQVKREAVELGLFVWEHAPEYYQEDMPDDLRYTCPFLVCGD